MPAQEVEDVCTHEDMGTMYIADHSYKWRDYVLDFGPSYIKTICKDCGEESSTLVMFAIRWSTSSEE